MSEPSFSLIQMANAREALIVADSSEIFRNVRYNLVPCAFHIATLCLIWITVVCLNILTLAAFYRKKSSRSNNHRFLISLTVNNLLGVLIILPFSVLEILEVVFSTPEAVLMCKIILVLFRYLAGVAVLNIVLIGYDRFLACVRNPLLYGRTMNYRRSLLCIGASWVIPALLLIPAIFKDFGEGSLSPPPLRGFLVWSRNPSSQSSAILVTVGNFALPFLALLAIYAKVFTAAKNNTPHYTQKSIVYKFKNHLGARTSINIGVNKLSPSSQNNVLYPRQNSASSLQSFLMGQEKRKTLHVIILILLFFVLCYSPAYAEAIISAFWNTTDQVVDQRFLHSVAQLAYFMGAVINPVIYVLCNSSLRQDIRRCFMRQAEIRRQTSLHLQGSFRSQCIWQSTSDKALTRHSICPDFHSQRKSCAAIPHVNIPIITCTSPNLSGGPPDENDIFFPATDLPIDNTRWSIDLPDEEEPNPVNSTAASRRSSFRSRKSVSFAEDNPAERTTVNNVSAE